MDGAGNLYGTALSDGANYFGTVYKIDPRGQETTLHDFTDGADGGYGTRVLMRTGNLAAVMRTMGHRDVKTAMHYQHPELETVPAALDYRPTTSDTAA